MNFSCKEVPMYSNLSTNDVKLKISERTPFLIRDHDIGRCKDNWTPEYITQRVGNIPVKIHVSPNGKMDFIAKNFLYKTLPLDDLVRRIWRSEQVDYFIDSQELYYLRSLGDDPRGKHVANFDEQFPDLAKDLKVPSFFPSEDSFSSVLRMGSKGIQLWTHFDVMDNILIQIRGRKHIVLWSPLEVENMYLIGDKSAVIDIAMPDHEKFPKFLNAIQHQCFMEPGDIIFIPAFWFHNTLALEPGVAVNMFWKNLDHEYYNKKDVYGNRDLIPGEKGLQMLDSAIKCVNNLPQDAKNFYVLRMIDKLKHSITFDHK